MSSDKMIQENLAIMNAKESFSVVVVCTSTPMQAAFWQKRLEAGRGSLLPKDTMVACVHEDWDGGAGNGLGTLYAFSKAQKVVTDLYQIDLLKGMQQGKLSAGLFHTAGKGTRLAPLPGAENNNKPGVKLPATVEVAGVQAPMTILESVIKQTGCYARSRAGRLSVFWGDQIFIPTVPVEYKVTHHADILCRLGPMVSEEEWTAKGLQNYGLIAQGESGNAAQVEKVDYATAMQMLKSFGAIKAVGASLGSFSVSSQLLTTLLGEFLPELQAKKGKMDSDPHLWMPMTLDKSTYISVMQAKKMTAEAAEKHFDRIQNMLDGFYKADAQNKALGTFGAVDVGPDCCWWDYGQLALYSRNVLLVTEDSADAKYMRQFFGYGDNRVLNSSLKKTSQDASSFIANSELGAGRVSRSVVSNVRCLEIDAEGAILINVTAARIKAPAGSIIYNVCDDSKEGIEVGQNEVRAGVFSGDGTQLIMGSNLSISGGTHWDKLIDGNAKTFAEVYKANGDADPNSLEKTIHSAHNTAWSKAAL